MRIAILAPPYLPVPPKQYGGTERIVSLLTEELVNRGHDVTLFASSDSVTSAKLVSVVGNALGNDGTKKTSALLPLLHIRECFRHEKEFDLIHNHAQYLSLFLAEHASIPVVHTWHGSYYEGEVPEEKRQVLRTFKDQKFISISNNQQLGMPELSYMGTVYNGLSLRDYPFHETSGNYLLWVGRITEKKGPLVAIKTAKTLGIPIKMAAAIDPIDQPYFDTVIKPELDSSAVSFVGEISQRYMAELYGNAIATLYPVTWHEPFGLVMIESMASGTPVVAYNMGAVPEIVEDKKTGFVIPKEEGIEGLVHACQSIHTISRLACRQKVEQQFTVNAMVDSYEAIYQRLISYVS